ncbi:MAG TPA: DUF1844 domain-containing protein [Thermoanaerobaculia bacterium]|nr:DUF1844 domain-containing protein [Thermoanaerobaculia bacterium]HQR68645.1 DUF1844 domain-containing protein [Thermoanaerobaculia bacterium]
MDRRLHTADGELREEAKAELERADAAPEPAPPAAPAPPAEPAPETNPGLLRLLDMLGQTAALYMEGFPDPATGRRQVDLQGARQIIDSLLALREKTRGRLSFQETDALEGLLGELQLVFARLAAPPAGRPPVPTPARRG